MKADSLLFPVPADTDKPALAQQFCHLRSETRKCVLILAEPRWTALGSLIEHAMRREVIQLCVIVQLAVFVPIVFPERSTVIHDECRSLRDSRFRENFEHIFVKRRDRQSVLVAMETVNHVCEV